MIKKIDSLCEQDYNDWRLMGITKRLFEYIDLHIEDIEKSMICPELVMPDSGNGHHNIIRLLGMLDGLQIIKGMIPSDILHKEELEDGNDA